MLQEDPVGHVTAMPVDRHSVTKESLIMIDRRGTTHERILQSAVGTARPF